MPKALTTTGVASAAGVILVMQFLLFGAFLDVVGSVMLFGAGYLFGRYNQP